MTTPDLVTPEVAASLLGLFVGELESLASVGVVPAAQAGRYSLSAVVPAYIAHLREDSLRAQRTYTQAEIAAHLDISDRRLRELLSEWGVDHRAVPLDDLRVRYLKKLREEAAGRASSGGVELTTERALLAREQREKIAMQNAVTRGELMPRSLLEQVLAATAPKVCAQLEAIVPALRKRTGYRSEDLDYVAGVIADARNAVAKMRLADVLTDADQDDDEVDPEESV
ncbi:MAG: hypothetical protein REI09_05280 [Candidatus Dactylopiibacterium sp.]|nr:hypothetical protein [Candidatus Dactylopiibacterium sp.]